MRAAENDHYSMSEFLLMHGVPVDVTNDIGATALMQASWNGAKECVELLLVKGHAKTDTTRKFKERDDEYTALCFATAAGHTRCIKSLLQHGGSHDYQKVALAIKIAAELEHKTCQELLEYSAGQSETQFVSETGQYQHHKGSNKSIGTAGGGKGKGKNTNANYAMGAKGTAASVRIH